MTENTRTWIVQRERTIYESVAVDAETVEDAVRAANEHEPWEFDSTESAEIVAIRAVGLAADGSEVYYDYDEAQAIAHRVEAEKAVS